MALKQNRMRETPKKKANHWLPWKMQAPKRSKSKRAAPLNPRRIMM